LEVSLVVLIVVVDLDSEVLPGVAFLVAFQVDSTHSAKWLEAGSPLQAFARTRMDSRGFFLP
jgi:hypothetical protein